MRLEGDYGVPVGDVLEEAIMDREGTVWTQPWHKPQTVGTLQGTFDCLLIVRAILQPHRCAVCSTWL